MIRKLALALAALFFLSCEAAAQNVTCATRPPGDSTNACASTAFVMQNQNAGGSIALPAGQILVGNASGFAAPVALSGDCTLSQTGAILCTGTNGQAFGYFATGTDASHLTGNLNIAQFNGGTNASSTTVWTGNGTWQPYIGRTKLTGPTNFYIATTGNNTTGLGTLASPWATYIGAWNNLKAGYDAGGQQVTINAADGTYSSSNCISGTLVGQSGPIIFNGDAASPASVIVKPANSPSVDSAYAFCSTNGANIQLQNMKLDEGNNMSPSVGSDTLAISAGAQVTLGVGMTFGDNINQWNDITVGGTLYITASYNITKTTVTATGTWTSGSNNLTVNNATGTIYQYEGVSGNGIPYGAFVANSPGNCASSCAITLGYVSYNPQNATTTSGTGASLNFVTGGQCHIDIGGGGKVQYETNGDPNYAIYINFQGFPMYTAGFYYASQMSQFYNQAVGNNIGNSVLTSNSVPFVLKTLSVMDTGLQGSFYVPGAVGSTANNSINTVAGSTTLTIASTSQVIPGNVVTLYEAPSSTFANNANPITLTGATSIAPGWVVTGHCIAPGTNVNNIAGTTVTLSHPTVCAYSGAIYFKDNGGIIPMGTYITSIVDSTHATMSQAALASKSGEAGWFGGIVQSGSQFQ